MDAQLHYIPPGRQFRVCPACGLRVVDVLHAEDAALTIIVTYVGGPFPQSGPQHPCAIEPMVKLGKSAKIKKEKAKR